MNDPNTSGSNKNDGPRVVMPTAKETAKQAINRSPDRASWADVLYGLYVKQKIEASLVALRLRRGSSPTRRRNSACGSTEALGISCMMLGFVLHPYLPHPFTHKSQLIVI